MNSFPSSMPNNFHCNWKASKTARSCTRLKVSPSIGFRKTLFQSNYIGGSSMLSVFPGHASIMNKVVSNFWSRLPHHGSRIIPPKISVEVRMSKALETLGALTGWEGERPTEPLCSLSFSCLSSDVIKVQSELLEYFKKDCHCAFSPLTAMGRPLRRWVGILVIWRFFWLEICPQVFWKRVRALVFCWVSWFINCQWVFFFVYGKMLDLPCNSILPSDSSFLRSKRGKRSERLEKKISRPDLSIQIPLHESLPTISATS